MWENVPTIDSIKIQIMILLAIRNALFLSNINGMYGSHGK